MHFKSGRKLVFLTAGGILIMKRTILALVPFLTCLTANAGGAFTVASGNCILETSREAIQLVNKDPFMHFGLFAEGRSSRGETVYLTQNNPNSIDIHLHGEGGVSYSVFPVSDSGMTEVRTGILMKDPKSDEVSWLSCRLVVASPAER
jgi:hypothetical protein